MDGNCIARSDIQFNYCGAASALVLGGFDDGGHVRMLLQHLPERLAENAHAAAVNDADARESGEERAIDKFLDFGGGLIDGLANHINFCRHISAFTL